MKKIYFTGHKTFGNRGCEAIIRSTVGILRDRGFDGLFLVPSTDIPRDRAQWRSAESAGVRFVGAHFSKASRYWAHAQRLPVPMLKSSMWPFGHPDWLKDDIRSADLVMAVGGDNYSLDYRIPGYLSSLDRIALDAHIPVVLWGASVGPFSAVPVVEKVMTRHLGRFSCLGVRESYSEQYLRSLAMPHVQSMIDPAFFLEPEEIAVNQYLSWSGSTIGLNLSPLIAALVGGEERLISEAVKFVVQTLTQDQYGGMLLIPHVTPLGAGGTEDDLIILRKVYEALPSSLQQRVTVLPEGLNAAELKKIIGICELFIGARTHSTIAAYSQSVPTISIGYSVKAVGIARDIFGDEKYCLPAKEFNCDALAAKVDLLRSSNESARSAMVKYKSTGLSNVNRMSQRVLDLMR